MVSPFKWNLLSMVAWYLHGTALTGTVDLDAFYKLKSRIVLKSSYWPLATV